MAEQVNCTDLLGLKDYAKSVEIATQGAVNGAAAFFGRICLPAAEEYGFLLKDIVSSWRRINTIKLANKTQALLEKQTNNLSISAHPRIIHSIIENGS